MAINRFFKPVDYEYTPIPFQELVTLGKYYADERKQAEKDLADYIRKANEFTSLISKDVDTYNKTAFNSQIKQYIEQAASNPSVMKDMGWRSGLQAAMNAVDYGMLNKLKSSAEAAKTYDTAVKKLAMEGKMYPGWEPNYFDTYSTADSGVFNATPLAWLSINDDVHPHVDNLKEALIRKEGNYNIMGVSRERIIEQVDRNMSEIMAHPRMQRRLQYRINSYEAMGKTAQEAYNDLVGEIYTAAMEKAWEKPEADPFKLVYAKSAATSGSGSPYGNGLDTLTQSIAYNGQQRYIAIRDQFLEQNYPDLFNRLNSTNSTEKAAAEKELKELRSKTNPKDVRKYEFYTSIGERTNPNAPLSDKEIMMGVLGSANGFGMAADDITHDIYSSGIQGISSDKVQTEFGNRRVIEGGRGLRLQAAKVAQDAGVDVPETSRIKKVDDIINSGALGRLIVSGGAYIESFPTVRGGKPSDYNRHTFYAMVPARVAEDKGLTEEDIKAVGGQVSYTKMNISSNNVVHDTTSTKYSAKDKKKNSTRSTGDTTTETTSGNIKYYVLPLTHEGAYTGDGILSESQNQRHLMNYLSGSQAGGYYGNVYTQAHD